MKVTLIAYTKFLHNAAIEATNGQWQAPEDLAVREGTGADLTEFCGRQCYESWHKPNPETATNEGYLANIIDHEHYSVLEHAVATFHIKDVSRSLTHELIRHRHFSYSELSQRFVNIGKEVKFITPPAYDGDLGTSMALDYHMQDSGKVYNSLVEKRIKAGDTRKEAREAARAVMPNMTPTAIVMTGNHRAWREMLLKRGSEHADAEIRQLAILIFHELAIHEPAIYQDIKAKTKGNKTVLTREW